METSKPGAGRHKAGLPHNWRIVHKTGTGDHGTSNDIALALPPDRKPILVAAYYTEAAGNESVLADVGKIVARRFA
jgi:beta-lactamase class A